MGPNLFNDSSWQPNRPYLTAILEEGRQASEAVVKFTVEPTEIMTELYLS